jgi:hypothetical protein
MRRQRGLVGLMGLAALVGLGLVAKPAVATTTTEQSASILVFPKVIADGTRDTIIQITNTSNSMRHAHCFYVNGALANPALPPGPNNQPLWTEIDFDIWLTKQQPTHWVVSTGRQFYPLDLTCRQTSCNPETSGGPTPPANIPADCCDAGFDPGRVPPVVPDFTGELKCIEVDATGAPMGGNSFKGEATLEDVVTGDVSKYNAIGLKGFDTNNMDGVLCLGGTVNAEIGCPTGAEYEACPLTWILDHPAVGAPDRVVEQQEDCIDAETCTSSVSTNVTFVPCTQNFETQAPPPVTLQFLVTNEFEQTFSTSTTFQCWASYNLEDIDSIFETQNLGGAVATTRVRSASRTPIGVMAVIEETHRASFTFDSTSAAFTARSAQNGHTTFQDQVGPDIITIPGDQIPPGF